MMCSRLMCSRLCLMVSMLWLASCGGGQSPPAVTAATAAAAMVAGQTQAPQRRALAVADADADTVLPLDAANELMDYAEVHYAQFFPSHATTDFALGYTYRYYPATGIYLGVRDGHVYVLGGAFGEEIVPVGPLAAFITPRPRTPSGLCSSAGAWSLYATRSARVGKNVGVTVAGCAGALSALQWQQTAGPTVALLSDKTQTLSFDPPQAGSYAFSVSFTDALGLRRLDSITLAVANADGTLTAPTSEGDPVPTTALTLRASHSVRMGGKVSVRAWPGVVGGDNVKQVTWTQIEGPPVELDTKTSRLALFTAPQVTRDTLIRLRATLHTDQARSESDDVMILVEHHAQAPADDGDAMWAGEHVPRLYAYQAAGPYRDALRRCVYDPLILHSGPRYNLCNLAVLPFIAQDGNAEVPSVEAVMSRVLVSHDWLGRNFESYLRTQDTRGDIRRMLKSVTAIVISTQIRPSYYYAGTGAIYLDADALWLTPKERDTINEAPDYRSDFGDELKFASLWRYVQNNQNIFAHADPRERITRNHTDLHHELTWLLFHELIHALDFLPPSAYASLQRSSSAWANISPRYNRYELTSDTVPAAYPLLSNEMFGLGQVQFHGATASTAQKAYTPADVASFFAPDLAVDDYNYSTAREDVAMTLEAFLMQHRWGIQRDVAITDAFASGTAGAAITVRWGQRGRIGEPAIQPRTVAIAQALVPWVDANEVALLPLPTDMRAGESWTANLSQPAPPRRAQALQVVPTWLDTGRMQRERRHMQQHRQGGKRLPPVAAGPA